MPTKNPRIQIAPDKPLYKRVHELAKRGGFSLSQEIQFLVRKTLSPYSAVHKPYTGKHAAKWVGRFRSSSNRNDPDEILASQVHG